jgi:hypothetical protein
MLTIYGTPEEVAADVAAQWDELSRVPLGSVGKIDRTRSAPADRHDDRMLEIAPVDYVQALTGIEIPRSGVIRCPLPDHDERTPSFKVYEGPERGWHCFGCGRGGTIYDLGAALWGISTRGSAFHDLRRELARELLRSES